MAINITSSIINTITNATGEKIFKYPGNTLLDLIYKELWCIIIDYLNYDKLFAIGLSDKTYPGYTIINEAQITKEFNKSFTNYYKHNKGIYLLIDISYINCCDLHIASSTTTICELMINNKISKLGLNSKLKQCDLIPLQNIENTHNIMSVGGKHYDINIGMWALFIKNNA